MSIENGSGRKAGRDIGSMRRPWRPDLRANGVEVIPFKSSDFLGRDLWSRIENKTLWGPATVRLNRALQRFIAETSPDVLFLRRPTHLFGSTLERILKNHPGLRVASYNNDNPFQDGLGWRLWRHYFSTARLSHVNFVFRPADVALAQRMGLPNPQVLLPWYVEGLHRPLGDVPPDFRNDVVFVGHYEPDGRVEPLNYLARQGVSVRIYGALCGRGLPWIRRSGNRPSAHCLWRGLRQGHRGRQDRTRLPVRDGTGTCIRRAASRFRLAVRQWWPPGPRSCRRCTAREKRRSTSIPRRSLLAKVRWLLEDDEARNRIAKAGRQRCLQDGHSNVHRGAQIIEALKGVGC